MNDRAASESLLAALGRERAHPCVVELNAEFEVLSAAGDFSYYGFEVPAAGADSRDQFPFLYASDASENFSWPLVETPAGQAMDAELRVDDTGMTLCITDATALRDAQQQQQQIANDVRILNYRMQQLTEALEQARAELDEANQLKSRFIAGMSHEFRTPLTSVLGYAQRIREQHDEDETLGSHIDAIQRGAKHLLSLVDGLLEQGRLDSGEILIDPVSCNLRELVGDIDAIFSPLAGDRGLSFGVHLEGVVPDWISVDEMRLRQLIVNLAGNAVKFTDSGGIYVTFRWRDERLEVDVMDSGSGIPEEMQRKIFMPFQRAHSDSRQGAGLGLAICRQLAERMNGGVELVRSDASGSLFRIAVAAPRSAPAEPRERGALDEGPALSSMGSRAVIVEDDADISSLLALYLEDAGFSVDVIDDGATALESLSGADADILITDMNLPGMDGITLISGLRAAGFSAPIIALSGSSSTTDQARAMQAGCNRYLVKPLPMEQVVDHVTREVASGNKNG